MSLEEKQEMVQDRDCILVNFNPILAFGLICFLDEG